MLIDVPMPAWLEQLVQELDVLLGLGNAAQAENANDAINAARLNLSVPCRGVVNRFDTDGDDLIDVIHTKVLDTFFERFSRNRVGLHAINLGDVAARGFPVAKAGCVVCVAGVFAETGKNICPHATSGADLDDSAIHWSAYDVVIDDTALDTTFEKRNDTLLAVELDIWPDGGPKCAKQGFAESIEGEERAIILVTDKPTNCRRNMRGRYGHESPWTYELGQDILDSGQDGHGEGGRGRRPSALRRLL